VERVVVEEGIQGLGIMLAELIKANLVAEPERERLLDGDPGGVNLIVPDAEVEVGLIFNGRGLEITEKLAHADLSITTDSDTLMELTNVPLRFGMPDTLTAQGRAIAGKLMRGDINVEGLPKHLKLMIRLQRLFTVA